MPQALYIFYMPSQARGWEFQMQSALRTPMGTGVQWYFVGDKLFLTHPVLEKGQDPYPPLTSHTSWVISHCHCGLTHQGQLGMHLCPTM